MHPSVKWGILAGIGVILLALGFGLGFGVIPPIIDELVEENLNLWDNSTEGKKNFVRIDLLKLAHQTQPSIYRINHLWIYT